MASKFVVALAFFAVCHSYTVHRSARSYTLGEGYGSGYGGLNQATASVKDGEAQAYGVNNNAGNIARDAFGNSLPGQAYAKAGTYDTPENINIGKAQPVYYPVPAPATVVTYQQYDVPETPTQIVYEGPALAQSSAATNGGYGSAASNADTGYGHAASNARTQGSGYGTASSLAQTNGIATPIASTEDVEASIIAAKNQGIHTVYTPTYNPVGYASSNANVNGHHGSAASTAKTGAVPTRKSISWHFGTAYDNPAAYAKAATYNAGYGSANANSNVNSGLESVRTAANSQGAGAAQSAAKTNSAGYGSVNSAANSYGGNANSNAALNNAGYATHRSGENYGVGYGAIRSTAQANGHGSANSNADIDGTGHGHAISAAKSQGLGSAQSTANTGGYGVRSAGWGSRTATDAQSSGHGNALSSAQNLSTEYRVNSAVNSFGYGSARANAHSA